MARRQKSATFNKEKTKSYWPVLLTSSFIFLLFLLPAVDTDLGWHLRYGEHFWNTGKILKENTLTYFLSGYKWPNSYTLSQILIFFLFKNFGFWGLSILNAVIMTAAFIVFNNLNPKNTKSNFILFLIIPLFAWNVFGFGFRAQILSFFFLILLIYVLEKSQINSSFLLFLPLVFVFWVNSHGAFVLGLYFLAVYLIFYLPKRNYRELIYHGSIFFLSFLATQINPWGIKVYQEALRHLQTPMGSLIAEWLPPSEVFRTLIVVVTTLLLFVIFLKKIAQKFFWIAVVLPFAYLGFSAQRNLAFFALIIVYFVIKNFSQILARLESNYLFGQFFFIASILTSVWIFNNLSNTALINGSFRAYCQKGMVPYPCKAVDFVKKSKIAGKNVFASYEWGGFLEWQLPEYKFFVDGRTPAWPTQEGESPYTIYLEIIQAQPNYDKTLEKYHTDWLFIPANTFLDIELQNNQTSPWKEIYRDEISAILTRK